MIRVRFLYFLAVKVQCAVGPVEATCSPKEGDFEAN